MSTSDDELTILRNARSLIADREHWGKGKFATNARGETLSVDDKKAECFCLMGALMRSRVHRQVFYVNPSDILLKRDVSFAKTLEDVANVVRSATSRRIYGMVDTGDSNSIIIFNDAISTTHEKVLKVLDDAIVRVEHRIAKEAEHAS